MIVGMLLLIGASILVVYNLWEAKYSEDASKEILSILQVEQSKEKRDLKEMDDSSMEKVKSVEIDGREYIGTLKIPSLNLFLPVLKAWDYAGLKIALGCYRGSSLTNDLIIAGHNYPRYFGSLKYLQVGEEIIFIDMEGSSWNYQVAQIEILAERETERLIQGEWNLTLFTCTLGGKNRVVVRCRKS
jgi:sortase A